MISYIINDQMYHPTKNGTIIYHYRYIPLYTIIYHYIPLYTIIYRYIPLYVSLIWLWYHYTNQSINDIINIIIDWMVKMFQWYQPVNNIHISYYIILFRYIYTMFNWLVVSNHGILFSIAYMGCHPSQLTNSYFSRWLKPPTRSIWII